MQTGVATFEYYIWSFKYPELAAWVPKGAAESFFDEATLYLDNTARSAIRDVKQRAVILGMITAHIAKLRAPIKGKEASPLVGRISNASEGSVSVAAELNVPAGSPQWYAQTQYGLGAWQAMGRVRGLRYLPGPRPQYNGVIPW